MKERTIFVVQNILKFGDKILNKGFSLDIIWGFDSLENVI